MFNICRNVVVTPLGCPVCDVIAVIKVVKRNLDAGEVLDGAVWFTGYGMIGNNRHLPERKSFARGLSEGFRLKCNVPKSVYYKCGCRIS